MVSCHWGLYFTQLDRGPVTVDAPGTARLTMTAPLRKLVEMERAAAEVEDVVVVGKMLDQVGGQ